MAPRRKADEEPQPRSRLGQKRNYVVPKDGASYHDDQSTALGTTTSLDDDPPTPRIQLQPLGPAAARNMLTLPRRASRDSPQQFRAKSVATP